MARPSLFGTVRLLSAVESALFVALLVVWLGELDDGLKFALGLTHGVGVIALCLLIGWGCLRGTLPWPLLAAGVSPLGPVAVAVGIEWLRRRRGVGPRGY